MPGAQGIRLPKTLLRRWVGRRANTLSGLRLAAREQVEDGPPGRERRRRGRRRRTRTAAAAARERLAHLGRAAGAESHGAVGREGHRVPVLGPRGPNWEIPGSALPSPPPRSPCQGGGNASRAQTPPPPPPPASLSLGACCCRRRRGTRRVLRRPEKRREPCQSPRLEERSLPATMRAPPAQAVPGLPPNTCAPRPGSGL